MAFENDIRKLQNQINILTKTISDQHGKIEQLSRRVLQLENKPTHVPSPLYGPPLFTDDEIPF